MNLCELLQHTRYDQKLYIYVTNIYGQNYCIGRGVRTELFDEDNFDELLYHLLDEISLITVANDKSLVVKVTDKHVNEPLENQYSEDYTKRWDPRDPDSRPFLYDCELEDR